MPPFVHLIADYGVGDPAFSEVVHRLTAEAPSIRVQATAVPSFSTVATGFWIEQLSVHNPPFDDLLVYSNTAPRTEDATPAGSPMGGELCYLELESGVPVVAVDAGSNLSFVKPFVEAFRAVETPATGSQFRSRDFFPKQVAEIATGDRSGVGADLDIDRVPAPPPSVVTHVDGYGNVKTSIRASAFDRLGERVAVTVNAVTREVVAGEDPFDVPEAALVLAPGSAGGDDAYLELVRRGGSAAAAFGGPAPGDAIGID